MLLRFSLIIAAALVFGSAAAFAQDGVGQSPPLAVAPAKAKPQPNAKKAKPPTRDVAPQSLSDIQFSEPYASPVGGQKAANSAPAEKPRNPPSEPKSNVSLDLKWRATNDKVGPYDSVHIWAPNGSGDAVEGGVKVGF